MRLKLTSIAIEYFKIYSLYGFLFQTESSLRTTSEDSNYLENEIDDSLDAKDDKNDWYYEDCTMQEYEVMKVKSSNMFMIILREISQM